MSLALLDNPVLPTQGLTASFQGGLGQARDSSMLLVSERADRPFRDLPGAQARVPGATSETVNSQQHDVRSRYFEVRVRLRLDDTVTEEHSLVVRNGLNVNVRWRERVAARP